MNRRYLFPALFLVLPLAPAAMAQEAGPSAPFRTDPVSLAQAVALQQVAVLAEAGAEGDDMKEVVPLFSASLAARAPALAEALSQAIDGLDETDGAAGEVARLADEARGVLVPRASDTAAFRGGLLAALLLGEGGVAEAYEEAAEGEAEEYAIGRAALGRARGLWDALKAGASPQLGAEGDAALNRLRELFPGPDLPERLSSDPEEAEGPAQQLVGITEAVTRADLYPGRDLGASVDGVRDLVAHGCATRASDPAMGDEFLAIAATYHAELLSDPLGVMAPEVEARVAAGFEKPDECGALIEALGQAREALAS